jgi:hypothetical protein
MPKPEPTKTPEWERLKSHLNSLVSALYDREDHRLRGNIQALEKLIKVHERLPENHPLREKVRDAALLHGCLIEYKDEMPPKVRDWFETTLRKTEATLPPPPEPKEYPRIKMTHQPISTDMMQKIFEWQWGDRPETRKRGSPRLWDKLVQWTMKRFKMDEEEVEMAVAGDEDARGKTKDGVVKRLTNRLLKDREFLEALVNSPLNFIYATTEEALEDKRLRRFVYSFVDGLVGAWAMTASDRHPLAWALQIAVAQEFGLTENYELMLRMLEMVEKERGAENLAKQTAFLYETLKPLLHKYVRAVYDETQEFLARSGLKELHLVRGLDLPLELTSSLRMELFTPYKTTTLPASSWTFDYDAAVNVYSVVPTEEKETRDSVVFYIKIPKEAFPLILSTFLTGWGCYDEFEVVLMLPGSREVMATLLPK